MESKQSEVAMRREQDGTFTRLRGGIRRAGVHAARLIIASSLLLTLPSCGDGEDTDSKPIPGEKIVAWLEAATSEEARQHRQEKREERAALEEARRNSIRATGTARKTARAEDSDN